MIKKDLLTIILKGHEPNTPEERMGLVVDEAKQSFVGRDSKGNVVRGVRKDAQVQRL